MRILFASQNKSKKDEISNYYGEVLMNFRGSNLDNSVGEIEFIDTNYLITKN